MRYCFFAVAMACVIAFPVHTHADFMARTEITGTTNITIHNSSLTTSAQLIFTIAGAPTLEVSSSGTGTAFASLLYVINRTDVPQQFYNANLSLSAPPAGTISPPIVPVAFTLDIAPNSSATMTSFSDVIVAATGKSSTDRASGSIGLHSVLTFFNNSPVDLTLTSVTLADSQYTLSLSGFDSTVAGLSALTGPFTDALTTNGSKTVPLAFTAVIPIAASQSLSIGGEPALTLVASIVPEPTSFTLLGIGAAGLAAYCLRRRKLPIESRS
jgi:hypothetical protein